MAESLLAFFYRRVRSKEVAADLVAETFAVAFEARGRFCDLGMPGGAWLYGIARRELSQYFHDERVELRAVHRLGIEVPAIDHKSPVAIEKLIESDGHRAELAWPGTPQQVDGDELMMQIPGAATVAAHLLFPATSLVAGGIACYQ